ncbi:hypothetical protein BT69DRAFT_1285150 [Atractiella rhizophila]|nr:hypothetical protein BT69DRAFT_1285150 [Atractiella rhizophila]
MSTVALGTHFESLSHAFLTRTLHMSLRQVGQANDRGVDLRGWWCLPDRRLRVIGQCKWSLKSKVAPRVFRELEGTVLRSHLVGGENGEVDGAVGGEKEGVLGVLCASRGFTKEAMRYWSGSRVPLMLVQVDDSVILSFLRSSASNASNASNTGVWGGGVEQQVRCETILWNDAARGVLGEKFSTEWRRKMGRDGKVVEGPVVLWNGEEVRDSRPLEWRKSGYEVRDWSV